jgi:hypothetical protein
LRWLESSRFDVITGDSVEEDSVIDAARQYAMKWGYLCVCRVKDFVAYTSVGRSVFLFHSSHEPS